MQHVIGESGMTDVERSKIAMMNTDLKGFLKDAPDLVKERLQGP